MYKLAKILFLLALVVWLGKILFLSLAVAPTLFGSFPAAEAGRIMSALFPVYYKIGCVAGAILLVTAFILRRVAEKRGSWTVVTFVVAVMLAATIYAGAVIEPRARALGEQLRAADAAQSVKTEFDALHHLAVQLNGMVLVGGIAIAIATASRLKP